MNKIVFYSQAEPLLFNAETAKLIHSMFNSDNQHIFEVIYLRYTNH